MAITKISTYISYYMRTSILVILKKNIIIKMTFNLFGKRSLKYSKIKQTIGH